MVALEVQSPALVARNPQTARRDFVSVVDAAYDLCATDEAWLQGLCAAAEPVLSRGLGLSATRFELDGQQYALFCFELPPEDLPSTLTAAERSVAQLALRGYSNKDIARARRTSVHTVANQLRTIYDKLGVSGRPGLLRSCSRSR